MYADACEGCYGAVCAATSIARVVRLGEHVLWMRPSEDAFGHGCWRDDYRVEHLAPANVLFSKNVWDDLARSFPSLSSFAALSPATNRDLVHLWFGEVPSAFRGAEFRIKWEPPDWLFDALREDALAADPVDLIPAANRIVRLLAELLSAPDEPATGKLVPIDEAPGTVESIYFDGDPFVEWFAVTFDPDALVIDGRWAWVRQPG